MLRAVSSLPLALLFLASAVPSHGQSVETTTLSAEGPLIEAFTGDKLYFEVRGKFELNCNALVSAGTKITWTKNGTALENWPELKGHIIPEAASGVEGAKLVLTGRATEDDYGNYTCSNGANQVSWVVKAHPHAKLPTDTNVVEEQKLKLTCVLRGRPLVPVQWTYSNVSDTVVNGTDVLELFPGRVSLNKSDQGVENGELTITSAELSDAGWYKCTPLAELAANATAAVTRLRVKDKFAALWPFLGICAEVFILCAIILVYERRRTKPELDDSDTDNHDQKKS